MTGAKIVYCGRDGLKHIYDISTKETTLGRRDDNQIFLPDELTSKYHAIVLTTSEGIFLKDKNSANGVKLNDKSIVPDDIIPLFDRDVISIGSFSLLVVLGANLEDYAQAIELIIAKSIRLVVAVDVDGDTPSLIKAKNKKKKKADSPSPLVQSSESLAAPKSKLSALKTIEPALLDLNPLGLDFHIARSISGKVLEAKYLKVDGIMEPYCMCKMDNEESGQVLTQISTADCFWAEPFIFDVTNGFRDLKFTIWNSNPLGQDKPLGKIVFPRHFLKSADDQWYMLVNADSETITACQLRIRIRYIETPQIIGYCVTIVEGRDVHKEMMELPNPFIVISVMNDKDILHQTKVALKSAQPQFNESFFISIPETYNQTELLITLWDAPAFTNFSAQIMGFVKIPLHRVVEYGKTDRWYSLSNFDMLLIKTAVAEPVKIKGRRKSLGVPEADEKLQTTGKMRATLSKVSAYAREMMQPPKSGQAHDLVEKKNSFASFGTCRVCKTTMVGGNYHCPECNFACHSKCKENVPNICGGVGSIRLKITHNSTVVFRPEVYSDLYQLMKLEEFYIPTVCGKYLAEREEAARLLIRIFNKLGLARKFVQTMIENEVKAAKEPQTLFRGNSMGSKALDIYMKFVGTDFLRSTLESILKVILLNKTSCELDPLRLCEGDHEEEALHGEAIQQAIVRNTKTLTAYISLLLGSIFKNTDQLPITLKVIFGAIQQSVIKKFPDDEVSRYTGVSGFLFLRFFVPAILGPRLFGLKVGRIGAREARTLTLISKTIQNLANCVEFGQKEPFMAPMNGIIKAKLPEMKTYLNSICLPTTTNASVTRARSLSTTELIAPDVNLCDDALAEDCAELAILLNVNSDKIFTASEVNPLLDNLRGILDNLQIKLDSVAPSVTSIIVDDTGRATGDETALETEEERKVMAGVYRTVISDINLNGFIANIVPLSDLKLLASKVHENETVLQVPPPLPSGLKSKGAKESPMARSCQDLFDAMYQDDPIYMEFIKENTKKEERASRKKTKGKGDFSDVKTIDEKEKVPTSSAKRPAMPQDAKSIIKNREFDENKCSNESLSRLAASNATTTNSGMLYSDGTQSSALGTKSSHSIFSKKDTISSVQSTEVSSTNDERYVLSPKKDTTMEDKYSSLISVSKKQSATPQANCRQCLGKLEGDVILAMGKVYHIDHFRCTRCQKDTSACIYYELENRPYCQPCYFKSEPQDSV